MRKGYDERHWFGRMGWPDLRASVARIIIKSFAETKANGDLDTTEPAVFVERLIASAVSTIEARREAQYAAQRKGWISSDHSYVATKWDYALTLFAETGSLAAALEKDFNILVGSSNRDIGPEQALRETMRQFLEAARRKQSPATEHRQKTWEAISRASSQIAAEYGPGKVIDRCSEEHFAEVQRRLHELYKGKNC